MQADLTPEERERYYRRERARERAWERGHVLPPEYWRLVLPSIGIGMVFYEAIEWLHYLGVLESRWWTVLRMVLVGNAGLIAFHILHWCERRRDAKRGGVSRAAVASNQQPELPNVAGRYFARRRRMEKR